MRRLFDLLRTQVPVGVWWPGESRFEIALGAVLTQNTTWSNVEIAITRLRDTDLLDPERLLATDVEVVGDLIRSSGYYRIKAGYVHALAHWWITGDDNAQHLDTEVLRSQLLRIRGIGSETADDILLYVYQRPVFIYDAYARRLLAAAGYGEYRSYETAKRAIDPAVKQAQFTAEELAVFHGLIVDGGKLARRVGGWQQAYPLLVSHEFATATSNA